MKFKKTHEEIFNLIYKSMLSVAVGWTWAILLMKVFKMEFVKTWPWPTILLPLFFYLMASLIYIIFSFVYYRFIAPPPVKVLTHSQRRKLNNMYDRQKETILSKSAKNLLILAIAIFLTALMLTIIYL